MFLGVCNYYSLFVGKLGTLQIDLYLQNAGYTLWGKLQGRVVSRSLLLLKQLVSPCSRFYVIITFLHSIIFTSIGNKL